MLSIVCLSGKVQMADWGSCILQLYKQPTTQVIQKRLQRAFPRQRIPLACKAKHEQQQIVDQNAINANTAAALRACATGVCVFVVDGVIADGVPRGGRNDCHLFIRKNDWAFNGQGRRRGKKEDKGHLFTSKSLQVFAL